jgi:hypothetical protein
MFRNFIFKVLVALPATGLALLTASPSIAADTSSEVLESDRTEYATDTEQWLSSNDLDALNVDTDVAPSDTASGSDRPEREPFLESAIDATSADVVVSQLIVPANDESPSTNTMAQVTSVTQLSDVLPTDWAYQALTSLIERYGCIAGYPNGTFRGNQPLSRYEFAAGMNACLESLNVVGLGTGDLSTIERLQEEFAAELASLRGRVDALEAQVAELEANQFSTTTKLNGHAIFSVQAVLGSDDSIPDQNGNGTLDDQMTFGYRVRMNFDSSFTGSDRLRARLQARDMQQFEVDPIGFSYGGTSGGDVELDDLFYDFPLTSSIDVRIGANSLSVDDFVASTISPLDSSTSGSISAFGFPSQYSIAAPGDAGAGAIFQISDNLSLDLGYTAGSAANPSDGNGLFNGSYGLIAQLTYLSSRFDAALTYIRSYDPSGYSFANVPASASTYGFQANYRISDGIELGGGLAYVTSDVYAINDTDVDIWSYQATLAFPDLLGEGNLGGILIGVPPRIGDAQINGNRIPPLIEDASLLIEGFYRYQVNDRISITPGIIWIADPGNNNDFEDTVIGAVRTVFSF